MKILNDDIKNRNFKKAYVLYGNEGYLINQFKNKFIDAFDDINKLNIIVFDELSYDAKLCKEAIITPPFFSDKKLIIFDNLKILKKKLKNIDIILNSLDNISDGNTILVIENNINIEKKSDDLIDKRLLFTKFIIDNGYFCLLDKLKDDDIIKWVVKKLKESKKVMKASTISYLIDYCGNDLYTLSNELNKLVLYIDDREEIEKDDINKVCVQALNTSIYKFIDYVNANDKRNAYITYMKLKSKCIPNEIIIASLRNNIISLLITKDMLVNGKTNIEIKNALGFDKSWLINKIINSAKVMGEDYLLQRLDKILNIEKKLKKGLIKNDVIIELLIS